MQILAIESSMMGGSVALRRDEQTLAEIMLDPQQRTAQTLAPAIQSILQEHGCVPRDIQLVAVTVGPGSFTGLRIGVTTAKTFAYATGCSILGVNTLRVIARQAPVTPKPLWVVMNAERAQVFVAHFRAPNGQWAETTPTQIMGNQEWIKRLTPDTTVTGPALKGLLPHLPSGVQALAEELWIPRAATLAEIAAGDFLAGRRDDLWKLLPQYFRESAAEEKAAGK